MIRFTWMQFRFQALVALGGLAIVAVVLGLTGPSLVHLYDASGFTTCSAHDDCSTLTNGLLSHDRLLQDLSSVLLVVPALIGLFWGRHSWRASSRLEPFALCGLRASPAPAG